MVALVAQHAHQLGGQRVVEQLHDALAPQQFGGAMLLSQRLAAHLVQRHVVQRRRRLLGQRQLSQP